MTDQVTGLVWQQDTPSGQCPADPNGYCTWADAQTYCEQLSQGGYTSGWTLPTVEQLFSLVDQGSSPTIDASAFPGAISAWYRSSSPSGSGTAWSVYFAAGRVNANPVSYANVVRCVR